MKDNGLQSIAAEARNRKSEFGLFKTIGAIIFIIPIIVHSFKWGWIYPIIALFALDFLTDSLGVFGIILGVVIMIGSVWLCVWRVRTMRMKRRFENAPKLYTPSNMRDDD